MNAFGLLFGGAVLLSSLLSIGLSYLVAQRCRKLGIRENSVIAAELWLLLAFVFFFAVRMWHEMFLAFDVDLAQVSPLTRAIVLPAPRIAWGCACLAMAGFSVWKDRRFKQRWLNPLLMFFAMASAGLVVLGLFSNVRADAAAGLDLRPAAGLRAAAEKRGFLIGGALRLYPQTLADPLYLPAFEREFNVVVPEHVMKFVTTHPKPDVYDFGPGDSVVKLARENRMAVRGHTLVWHDQVPGWVLRRKGSSEALRQILHDYILKVAGHFRGQLLCWDVVNEAVDDDGDINAEGPWPRLDAGRKPGDYIRDAFRWAREADPEALLFYNDYGAEELNKKSDGIYRLLKTLKEEGVPIQGVGFQTHISYDQDLSEESVRANFKRFGDLGLDVHVTEMDVSIPKDKSRDPDALQKQAGQYRKILGACLQTPRCRAFLTWGLTDKYTWIDDSSDKTAPLLLDRQYRPKPAYDAVRALLETPR